MPSPYNESKAARYKVLPGFPDRRVFKTPEEISEYFSQERITCLECGKKYKTLGVHLKSIHGMEPDEYREAHGIPWTYGLQCPETKTKHSELAKEMISNGIWVLDRDIHVKARKAPHRPRQPFRGELVRRNLEILNAGKDGHYSRIKRQRPKRGTDEFKKVMRARNLPQKEILKTYWVGKTQSDEHKQKRFRKWQERKEEILSIIKANGPVTSARIWTLLGAKSRECLKALLDSGAIKTIKKVPNEPDVQRAYASSIIHYVIE